VVETDRGKITLVADGYSAPVTAGNCVDLVQRGFYDGLEFTRVEEFYVVQAGDPERTMALIQLQVSTGHSQKFS